MLRSGFKRRYYLKKFHVDILEEPDFPKRIVHSYIEGLVWVLAYYYQGCASWSWFYPFHYAPFASDFTELASMPLRFRLAEPYRPLEQLMAVLPPRSSHALPEAHAKLMLDKTSKMMGSFQEETKQNLPCRLPLLVPFGHGRERVLLPTRIHGAPGTHALARLERREGHLRLRQRLGCAFGIFYLD